MCCPSVGLVFLFSPLNKESWLDDQDSGFRNRTIKHSLKTKKLILVYRRSTKMHKTIGTPPCTFRQPWVSVVVSTYTHGIKSLLLKNTCTSGLSVANMRGKRIFFFCPILTNFFHFFKKPNQNPANYSLFCDFLTVVGPT